MEELEARKVKLTAEEVWPRLQAASGVVVGKGQKVLEFVPGPGRKEAILAEVIGRSGTLRAPTLLVQGIYYVGFNEKMYEELMQ